MAHDTITSFRDFQRIACDYRARGGWMFRGQGNSTWKFIPKAGRLPSGGSSNFYDRLAFQYWKFCATEHIRDVPRSDWDWLAVAQHSGLATRFLDWTHNPLVAAFFAVRRNYDCHAKLAAIRCRREMKPMDGDPMEFTGVGKYTPRRMASRIAHQAAAFTIHGPPDRALISGKHDDYQLQTWIIDRKYRSDMVRELEHLYIHEASLFPDLDGLSAYVNWKRENQPNWLKHHDTYVD